MVRGLPLEPGTGKFMKRILLPLLSLAALTVCTSFGQDAPQYDQGQVAEPDGQYEEGRARARISVLNGDVSVRRGEWGAGAPPASAGPWSAPGTSLFYWPSRADGSTTSHI